MRAGIFLITVLFSYTSCAVKLIENIEGNSVDLLANSVEIESDQILIRVVHDSGTGYVPALGGATATLGGSVPALAGIVPAAGGNNPGLGGDTPIDGGATSATTGNSSINGSSYYTSTVTVSAQFPQGATASCVVNLPYYAYSCTVGESFNFENEDITSSNFLSATVFPKENPSSTKISNNLMTRFYRITQVSNTRNNNALSDIANIPNLTAYGGEVYFMSKNASGADKIFKTDGNIIAQVTNLRNNQTLPDYINGNSGMLASPSDGVYFTGYNSLGFTKLFKTDGTTITQISNTRNNNSLEDSPQVLNLYSAFIENDYFFSATNSNGVNKLFKTDGTTVVQVSNTRNNNAQSDEVASSYLIHFNNEIYFFSRNSNNAFKLFKTDGTTLVQMSNTRNNQASNEFDYSSYGFIVYNNELYTSILNANGINKLFKTNGSNLVQVSNVTGDNNINEDWPSTSIVYDNNLYFSSSNSSGGFKFYRTDGTEITQVANTSSNQAFNDSVNNYIVFDNELYFTADNQNSVDKLYKTNGEIVTQVSNTRGNNALGDSISNLFVFDDLLFFQAANTNGALKLFATNGSSVVQISNTRGNNSSDDMITSLYKVIESGGELFFAAYNSSGSGKLFKLSRE